MNPPSLSPRLVLSEPTFFCDAMLGGVSRWLRAVGYRAWFEHGIDDGELLIQAERLGAMVLSSDAPLFRRRALKDAKVQGLFVPRHAPVMEQVVFVLRELNLSVRQVRCMVCSGSLCDLSRTEAETRVPAKVLELQTEFWQCSDCKRIYWQGTHWNRIAVGRSEIERCLREGSACK
jgi:uncharacterized protein